ncbi:hypothetical protein CKAN_02620200 [Cinnamomum micranthum f. kanehirae]|uniref:DUF674 domain-containing protein n=1 Tax=Cinnamomum micranthum f. kanehirae TaxID=337451 RepID=A0A443Q1B1_9MAGN|nr:hypothetical protein CKAN_02620200 [Cinnamomum micranthum f. kanehirae]
MATTQMSLKLVVDKKMNRVVFAECGNDFVDVLLSFLTMPIGTIIRLTRKESKIGGMSTLYESAEDLDVNLLQTEACKKMLLYPKNASEEHCKNLKVNIDDTEPTKYYACSWDCCAIKHGLLSTFYNAQCGCGQSMSMQMVYNQKLNGSRDGVFVKRNMRFIIGDDLQVFPVTSKAVFTLLYDLGISDASVLEERNVNVGPTEVLHLLNRLLLSKTPLKDVFLRDQDMIDCSNHDFIVDALHGKDLDQPQKVKGNGGSNSKKISVKLSVNKSNNKVVYAEGGEEFADLLFSFLAFPLGFLTKFFGGDSGIRCLDNLYRSVLVLKDFLKSKECKGLLTDPNLATFFSCNNQPLQVKEQNSWQPAIVCCYKCILISGRITITDFGTGYCDHGYQKEKLCIINPKYPNAVKELGGTHFAGPALFMVTDELHVMQLSPMSALSLLTKLNISMSDIEEHVVSVGEKEAASLLVASLISKTVLTDALYPKKPEHLGKESYNKVENGDALENL